MFVHFVLGWGGKFCWHRQRGARRKKFKDLCVRGLTYMNRKQMWKIIEEKGLFEKANGVEKKQEKRKWQRKKKRIRGYSG